MRAGQIIAERTTRKQDGTDFWKVYTVKSVTQTGVVTLLRADPSSSMEAKTTKGFAQAVEDGKLEDWRVLDTSAIDIVATNAIRAGGKVELGPVVTS